MPCNYCQSGPWVYAVIIVSQEPCVYPVIIVSQDPWVYAVKIMSQDFVIIVNVDPGVPCDYCQ